MSASITRRGVLRTLADADLRHACQRGRPSYVIDESWNGDVIRCLACGSIVWPSGGCR